MKRHPRRIRSGNKLVLNRGLLFCGRIRHHQGSRPQRLTRPGGLGDELDPFERILVKIIEDRIERALDDALNMTFPASDPIAVYAPFGAAEARIEANPPLATERSRSDTRGVSIDAMDHS